MILLGYPQKLLGNYDGSYSDPLPGSDWRTMIQPRRDLLPSIKQQEKQQRAIRPKAWKEMRLEC